MTESLSPRLRSSIKTLLERLAAARGAGLAEVLAQLYAADAEWRGSHPINEIRGRDAILRQVWEPLTRAMPDMERRDDLFIGGSYGGRLHVAAVGHYVGTFAAPWLGIAPSGGLLYLRYGEVHRIADGRLVQSTVLLDVLDAMRQSGRWPLPAAPLGSAERWAAPLGGDGVRLQGGDARQAAASLELTLAMQDTLKNEVVERRELLDMEQRRYWHPQMMWYGPAGVGTTRGLEGFVDFHQHPFRVAFPVRDSGNNHYIRMGDGAYSVTGGWPSVITRHRGPWLGIAPTDAHIEMRVMDFYAADGGLIRENWVPIDMLHILLQMGRDLLAEV